MPPITVSTEIDPPAEDVFAYATDPTRFHQWQAGVVGGSVTYGRGAGAGVVMVERSRARAACLARRAASVSA
ncbi:SRPBCC family protein [Micromonospora coerulea]|uniref:SRPBCC family protein n=1 Tax=Micromonospora coerulea TaxID=47856 RepID=UPI0019052D31